MDPALRSMVTWLGAAVLAAAAPSPLTAQQPAGRQGPGGRPVPLVDRVEVRLAEIPVVVTDRQGRPVSGLGRDDFELLQDDEPVDIRHFTASGPGALSTGSTDGLGSAPRQLGPDSEPRLLALVFDPTFLQPGETRKVFEGLESFLTASLPADTRLMLATLGQEVEIRQRPTTDPHQILQHRNDLGDATGQSQQMVAYQQLLRDVERTLIRGRNSVFEDRSQLSRTMLTRMNTFVSEIHTEIRRSVGLMDEFLDEISRIPGRKEVLYIAGGIPVNVEQHLFDLWQSAFGTSSLWQSDGVTSSGVSLTESGLGRRPEAFLDRLAQRANSYGITIHTLSAGGLKAPALFDAAQIAGAGERGSSAQLAPILSPSQRLHDERALRQLSDATGGRAIVRTRKLRESLDALIGDWSTYYLLSFQPRPNPERQTVALEVRLSRDRKKLSLRYPQSLRPQNRDHDAAERTLRALVRAPDEDGSLDSNALEVEISVHASEEPGKIQLRLQLPLTRLGLVAEGAVHRAQITLFLTSGRQDGSAGEVRKATIPLRIENRDLLTLVGRKVDYRVDLPLEPGADRVAISVRDDFAPGMSSLALPLADAAPPHEAG